MNEWQSSRDNKFKELYVTLYLLCTIIFSMAILIKFNWHITDKIPVNLNDYITNVSYFIILLLICLLGSVIIIRINALSLGVLILSVFVFIFMAGYQDYYLKTLLIIPVAFASFSMGKKFGCAAAFICGTLLYMSDLYIYDYSFPNKNLESDIIFSGILFIIAWLIGGIAEIEQDTRNLLLEMANRDGLSGLYNHRYFQVHFKSAIQKAKHEQKPLSLIIFDIDYFKYFNDTFGHIAGDRIIKDIGKILQEKVTSPAVAARYGGDEFCVLLPDLEISSVYATAKNIKDNIESLSVKNAEKLPAGKITVTAGIANYPEHTKTIENLLELADQALYKAKNVSKDKIELYFNVLDSLKSSCDRSETELLSSIKTLLSIINAKDRYTYGHSERVLEYATMIAKNYGLSENELKLVQYGAYLHDIGKIEIDIDILNATGKLTDHEWNILKQHPYWGSEIIRPIKSLEKVIPYVLYHHENYDGTGYPHGIGGVDIPLGARIIRIADSFDAMTTDRPYKKGMSINAACNELLSYAGSLYDPALCTLFVNLIREKPYLISQNPSFPKRT